jgi:epoxide hydrolase
MIQISRPQTLAHGLHDSPVGQLAWIVEKFKEWTDPAAELPEDAVDRDLLLTNVMLYWLTGTAGSSANSYYEAAHAGAWGASERSTVPTGAAVFPLDVSIRRTIELEHTIVHWSEFGRGGHFAAMEAPDLLVDDVRDFFSKLRWNHNGHGHSLLRAMCRTPIGSSGTDADRSHGRPRSR